MTSAFGGLHTAMTSLYAQRRGLDVTGQNIANANTEGYTRQRVEMVATPGATKSALWAKSTGLGAGVGVYDVQRLRDEQLEARGRGEHARNTYLTNQAATYSTIEDVFAEPGDTALQAQLHQMWGAWSDVANNPSDPAARTSLLQQSSQVADTMHQAYGALATQWQGTRAGLDAIVEEVNTSASAIAQLNDDIVQAKGAGAIVNELQDQRDNHLMHIAELVGGVGFKRDNGAMDVFVGGQPLVSLYGTRKLETTGALGFPDPAVTPPADPVLIKWADNGAAATTGGTVGSMMDTITTIIPGFAKSLNDVANSLISTVNTAHTAGYGLDGVTGRPFFSGTGASDIAVAITDLHQVAASSTTFDSTNVGATVGSFDSSVADTLAQAATLADGPDKTYQNMIAQLGGASQIAGRRSEIQANVVEQSDAQRESESGVNIDEEMANMIKYQRGYEAASRVLNTVDEMLDLLINRTGMVGR